MTTVAGRAPARVPRATTAEQAAVGPRPAPPGQGTVCALVLATLLGQRFALPVGDLQVPAILLVHVLAAAWLLLRRAVRLDDVRVQLLVLAAAGCAVVSCLRLLQAGESTLSVPSLLLLLAIYAPWVLRARTDLATARDTVLRTFVRTMLVLSLVGAAQMVGQYSGAWQYEDYVREVVPEQFLLTDYNTSTTLDYFSTVYRANAFLLLEPSFLSQFCALAIVVALLLQAPAWHVLVLAAGLASAVSGTGFVLLAVGLVALVVRRRQVLRPVYVVVGLLATVSLLFTPFAEDLLTRSGEFTRSGSSASLRFVKPYTETVRGLDEDPARYLVGAGPGASDRLLLSSRDGNQANAVTYTTAPKLAFEYGLVAGGLFMLFLLVTLFWAASLPVLPTVLLTMTWLLSGALLQPHTAVLVWLLSTVWASPGGGGPSSLRVSPPVSLWPRPQQPAVTPTPDAAATR